MKSVFLFVLKIIPCILLAGDSATRHTDSSANKMLDKVYASINNLSNISFYHKRIINYRSTGVYNLLEGNVFFDFMSQDTILGIRFYADTKNHIFVFNGSEEFHIDKKSGDLFLSRVPQKNALESISILNHSLLSLKKAIPWIIADHSIIKNVYDTMMDNQRFVVVRMDMKNAAIYTSGERWHLNKNVRIVYRIIISPDSFLPVQICQNLPEEDELTTSFSAIKTNISSFDQSLFYYSNYTSFHLVEADSLHTKSFVNPGEAAPGFTLRSANPIDGQQSVSLKQYKGKVVLLDFWIIHCGYCIEVIPMINRLRQKYWTKDFVFLSLNSHDSVNQIHSFIKKYPEVNYPILYEAKETADLYGVPGYPTFVLLDKQGKVIYAGPFEEETIDRLISKIIAQ